MKSPITLGHAAKKRAERERSLREAVVLWPEFATARAELGSLLASTGRAGEAPSIAERAVELAPWNPKTIASLAAVTMKLGKKLSCFKPMQLT